MKMYQTAHSHLFFFSFKSIQYALHHLQQKTKKSTLRLSTPHEIKADSCVGFVSLYLLTYRSK